MLREGDTYHIQHGEGVRRAEYKGKAGPTLHWWLDLDAAQGGQLFLDESEFTILGHQGTLEGPGAAWA